MNYNCNKNSNLSNDDYNNLTKRDSYLNPVKEWRRENAEILSKSKFFSVEVTMKNYKKSHDELLTYCHTPFNTYEDNESLYYNNSRIYSYFYCGTF